jgi:hypothetical protein
MFKTLGLKNLVSPASIRAPLYENFAGITDLYVAGVSDPKMLRDIETVSINGVETLIHLGGMADVWLNTSSIVQEQVSLTYVPSSLKVNITSEAQAQQNAVLTTFDTSLLTLDGRYSSDIQLDESSSVQFGTPPSEAFEIGTGFDGTYQLATQDKVAGINLVPLPCPGNDNNTLGYGQHSRYLIDLYGVNFSETSVAVGDLISCIDPQGDAVETKTPNGFQLSTDTYRRITGISGSVIQVGPPTKLISNFAYSSNNGSFLVNAGSLYVNYPVTGGPYSVFVNATALIQDVGYYRVLGSDTNGFYCGVPIATVSLVPQSGYTYQIEGNIPPDLDTNCWVYTGTDGGYSGLNYGSTNCGALDPTKWFPITAVTRNATGNTLTLNTASLAGSVLLVRGIRSSLLDDTLISFEKAAFSTFYRATRELYGTVDPVSASTGHTLYCNTVDPNAAVTAGSTTFQSLGIGINANQGDLIVFDGFPVQPQDLAITGGDGSKITVFVKDILDNDSIEFSPALPFDIPANTQFVLMRNSQPVSELIVSSLNQTGKTITFNSFPLGLGDGTGMGLMDGSGNWYTITGSTAGLLTTLQFAPPVLTVDIVMSSSGYAAPGPSDIGATVKQTVGSSNYSGILFKVNAATRTWSIIPNSSGDVFAVSGSNAITLNTSPASGFPGSIGTQYTTGYGNPNSGDIGKLVRQGNYVGILNSFNSTTYTWLVSPASPSDLFDSTTEETFLDYGTGVPGSTGFGYLSGPASVPVINAGSCTVTVDATPSGALSDTHNATLQVYSRFGLGGGFFNGKNFQVYNNVNWNTNPFPSVVGGDELNVLLGANYGQFNVVTTGNFSVGVPSPVVPDVVRLAHAPAPFSVPSYFSLTLGQNNIALSGSNLGVWAQPGRILIVATPSNSYYYTVAGPNGNDGLTLQDLILVPVSAPFTLEVVEGYITPFWNIPEENFMPYRVFTPPNFGDVIFSGTTAYKGIGPALTDINVNFTSVLESCDLTQGDFQLYLDSGVDAGVYTITSYTDNTLTLAAPFSVSESGLSYRLVYTKSAPIESQWYTAVVISSDTIELLSFPGEDLYRNNCPQEMEAVVESYNPDNGQMQCFPVVVTPSSGGTLLCYPAYLTSSVGQPCSVLFRYTDRASAHTLPGQVVNTFNYYNNDFFSLPLISVSNVQLLNPDNMQIIKDLPFTLQVNDTGLRYSSNENNSILINDSSAILQPVLITYMADLSIDAINQFLNAPDNRVINANQLAKRMETILVDLSCNVRSTNTVNVLQQAISLFINTAPSYAPLSIDKIIQYLYAQNLITYLDVSTVQMNGTYLVCDGTTKTFSNVTELFGASTACYVSRNINVALLPTLLPG